MDLDGLETWNFAERVLGPGARRRGAWRSVSQPEKARGMLPPGALSRLGDRSRGDRTWRLSCGPAADDRAPTSIAVNFDAPRGTKVVGTVRYGARRVDPYASPTRGCPRNCGWSAWLRLLALTAAIPEREFEAVTIARGHREAPRDRLCRWLVSGDLDCTPSAADSDRREVALRLSRDDRRPLFPRDERAPTALLQDLGCLGSGGLLERGHQKERPAGGVDIAIRHDAGEDKELEHILVLGGALSLWREITV